MNDDSEILDFVRQRLEDGVAAEPPRMAAILHAASKKAAQRRLLARMWGGAALAAASVALACSFAAIQALTHSSPTAQGSSVGSVIALLRTAEGDDAEYDDFRSEAEMLLAWQDAPYEDAVACLATAAGLAADDQW